MRQVSFGYEEDPRLRQQSAVKELNSIQKATIVKLRLSSVGLHCGGYPE